MKINRRFWIRSKDSVNTASCYQKAESAQYYQKKYGGKVQEGIEVADVIGEELNRGFDLHSLMSNSETTSVLPFKVFAGDATSVAQIGRGFATLKDANAVANALTSAYSVVFSCQEKVNKVVSDVFR